MNVVSAQNFLGVGETASASEIRQAYLQRVGRTQLATDPDGFIQLRVAYETLIPGSLAHPGEVAAARDVLARTPDSAHARWALLAVLRYTTDPEALAVLREGAARQPGEFLDDLIFHFPEQAPPELVATASHGADAARRLLVADVHAAHGRSTEALAAIGEALAQVDAPSRPAIQKLALRPVLSLHARNQLVPADAMLATVMSATDGADGQSDEQRGRMLAVARELERLPDLPLELRQVAARAAKNDFFENARYEARFATRLLPRGDVHRWRKRLAKEAPTLAEMFALDLSEDQLRPRGVPNFRIAGGTGVSVLLCVLYLAWRIHLVKAHSVNVDDLFKDLPAEATRMIEAFNKASCPDERCRRRTRLLLPIELP